MHGDLLRTFNLPDGSPAAVVIRRRTVERLRPLSFRGHGVNRSGNMFNWNEIAEWLDDQHTRTMLKEDIRRTATYFDRSVVGAKTIRFGVKYPAEIGWASTDDRSRYEDDVLESFKPNRQSSALRVKREHDHLLAPATDLVTVVSEFKFELGKGWVIIIHSLYPGPDIGELRGNVTTRSGCVFFDFSHPGV